jgi:hypothetical protein
VLDVLEHRALHRIHHFTALLLWTGMSGKAWGAKFIGNLNKIKMMGSIFGQPR